MIPNIINETHKAIGVGDNNFILRGGGRVGVEVAQSMWRLREGRDAIKFEDEEHRLKLGRGGDCGG